MAEKSVEGLGDYDASTYGERIADIYDGLHEELDTNGLSSFWPDSPARILS